VVIVEVGYVMFVERYPDLGPHQGMAALLRF
jgi:hypothetical protein